MKILKESFEIHSTLNKQLFNLDTQLLKEDIRLRLIKIADEFVESIQENEIPIHVYDYWLLGSNAAYNYTKDSDIDIHVIVNLEDIVDVEPYIMKLLYNFSKTSFNSHYDVTVKGHEIELYVQDINEPNATNGIYSLKKNEWIKVPAKEEPKIYDIESTELYKKWLDKYNNLKDEDIEQFIFNLYLMRKTSLANEGEFGEGNLVFKQFRNDGILDELKDRKYQFKSKELTLEKLEEDVLYEVGVSGQTHTKKQIYDNLSKEEQQEIESSLGAKPNDNFSALVNIHHLNGDHNLDIPCNRVLINHGKHSSLQKIASLEDIDEKANKYAKANILMYGNCVLDGDKIKEQTKYCESYQGKDVNFFKTLLLYIESKK